jgi:hypothetical protein
MMMLLRKGKNMVKFLLKCLWKRLPLSKDRKSIIQYEFQMKRKLRYLRRDISFEMKEALVSKYQESEAPLSQKVYEARFQELTGKYKKIHIVKNNILNIGPMCDLYLSLSLLLEKYSADEKLLLLLYDENAPVYDEGNPRIANHWFLKKIKELVEIIDADTAPFWGYVVKEHPESCDFDSADPFGRVIYPNREQVLHHDINRYPSKVYLSFSEDERKKGDAALVRMGLKTGKYFCFFSRSNEYHETYFKNHGSEYASQTAVRNSSIEDFAQSIRQLNLPDVKAVRMGAIDSRRVTGGNILDYTNMYRDEFLDFFIMGNAKFFLGDESGLACIPWLMNIPQAITNNLTIFWWAADYYNYNSTMNYTIYKKWWHRKKNRYLTLQEILDLSWKYGLSDEDEMRLYRNLGIDFHNNTVEEIADFLYEMNLRIDGKWQTDEEETALRKKYWQMVNETLLKAPPEMILWDYEPGGLFLKRNKWLLE